MCSSVNSLLVRTLMQINAWVRFDGNNVFDVQYHEVLLSTAVGKHFTHCERWQKNYQSRASLGWAYSFVANLWNKTGTGLVGGFDFN